MCNGELLRILTAKVLLSTVIDMTLLNIGAFIYVMCFEKLNFRGFLSYKNYPLTQFCMCYPKLSTPRKPFDLRDLFENSISVGFPILQFS